MEYSPLGQTLSWVFKTQERKKERNENLITTSRGNPGTVTIPHNWFNKTKQCTPATQERKKPLKTKRETLLKETQKVQSPDPLVLKTQERKKELKI